jgi:Ca2+-binding EF-hand superfamily protein
MNLPQRLVSVAALAAVLAMPALAQTISQQAAQAPSVTALAAPRQPMTPEQRAARFDKADANHDGKLTKAEFTASLKGDRAAKVDKMWSHLNPASKESITKAEFLAAPMGHGKGSAKAG